MGKLAAIRTAYQIATLAEPSTEVLEMLAPLPFERTLELLLILRQSEPVRSPLNFLRRAIEESWTPETPRQSIDRRKQNRTEQFYINRGYTLQQAREKAKE